MLKIKSPTIVLFSKNHELNELDKLKLESKTSDFLKDYWKEIDSNIILAEQEKKRSTMNYLNRFQSKKKNRTKPIKRKSNEEKNVKYWKNSFLGSKLEKALKDLDDLNKNSLKNTKLKKIKRK